MRFSCKMLGVAAVLAVGALSTPAPAQAWWYRGGFYGPRVIFAPPPVFIAPRPVYVGPPAPYYGPFWIRAHYDRFGYFVPGHWR